MPAPHFHEHIVTTFATTTSPSNLSFGQEAESTLLAWIADVSAFAHQNRLAVAVASKALFWLLTIGLVSVAGIMSGLTLALFTLDINSLKGLSRGHKELEKRQALRVLPLLEHPHWTLVTLLVANAAAVESLPLALDHVFGQVMAVVMSVVLVLVFGEIMPQAFFTKYALPVSSFFAPFVSFLTYLTFPISWPVAWILDTLVGHKVNTMFRRTELRQLLLLHKRHEQADRHEVQHQRHEEARKRRDVLDISSSSSSDDEESERIKDNEMRIMMGALSLSELTAKDVMKVPAYKMFYIEGGQRVSRTIVASIFSSGFSRVLVHDEASDEFLGYFLSRDLVRFVHVTEDEAPLVRDLPLREPLYCSESTLLGEVYQDLCDTSTPMILVLSDQSAKPMGLMTFEDVFEAVHGVNIADEFDHDSHSRIQSNWKTRLRVAKRVQRTTASIAAPLNTTFSGGDVLLHTMRGGAGAALAASPSNEDLFGGTARRPSARLLPPRTPRTGGGAGPSFHNNKSFDDNENASLLLRNESVNFGQTFYGRAHNYGGTN